jgi:hypothetical protein
MLSSSFSLSWSAVERAREYLLDISTNPNYGDYKLNFNNYSVSGTTNITITSLDKSQIFFCRLRSNNPYETSSYSEVSGYTLAPEPTGLIISDITPNGFTVSWDDIDSDLIASYNFVGNYRDSSSNDNHGFASGSCNATSGFVNIPSGTISFVEIPSGVVDGLTEFTIAGHLKLGYIGHDEVRVVFDGYKDGYRTLHLNGYIDEILYGSTSTITFSCITPSVRDSLPITGTTGNDYLTNGDLLWDIPSGATSWIGDLETHHFAITRDVSGFVTLYIDGVEQNSYLSGDDTGQYFTDALQVEDFVLGNSQYDFGNGSGYAVDKTLGGNLDTIRFYSRCLTASEIDAVRQLHHDLN